MGVPEASKWTGAFLGFVLLCLPAVAQEQKQQTVKPAVIVAPVVDEPIVTPQVFVGTVEAIQEVELRARVEGFLDTVAFKEGQMVKANELLYQIEQAQYQASLDQSKAQEAEAQAALLSAQAQAEDTQAEFERQAQLLTRGNTSQARYDQSKAARDQAKAAVSQAQAQIEAAKANIEQAQLNLSYTQVTSPIAGKIGKTAVTQGNLVDPSTGVLATVVQLNPIRVVISVSDAEYVQVVERINKLKVEPDKPLYAFELTLPTGQKYDQPGSFSFVDNQVDPNTGTIAVRINFDNPEQLLVPGQFVRVTTSQAEPEKKPVVPAKAVQQDRKGRFVFVIGQDNRAIRRDITVGPQVKDGWAVESGLTPGEMVIVDGIQKIANGVEVTPHRQSSETKTGGQQGASQGSGGSQGQSGGGSSGSSSGGSSN